MQRQLELRESKRTVKNNIKNRKEYLELCKIKRELEEESELMRLVSM